MHAIHHANVVSLGLAKLRQRQQDVSAVGWVHTQAAFGACRGDVPTVILWVALTLRKASCLCIILVLYTE